MKQNKRKLVPLSFSIHWRYMHQDGKKTWRDIKKLPKYKQFSKATISRHMSKALGDVVADRRKTNKGRPRKLTLRDERNILREAEKLRKACGYFSTKRVIISCGLTETVCDETVRRVFRKHGFRYCHSRKKGVLKRKDLVERFKFAKKGKNLVHENLWTEGISFYLDGVGFAHKFNPFDQAMAPRTMAWRKRGDGLSFQQTARGSHEGTGGRVAHFICAIAYGRGFILAQQYDGHLNGQKFADFVREQFPQLFTRSANPRGRLFLQDGDPSQNSRKAKDAFDDVHARMFHIPPRSPDINPIENVFNNVKQELREFALRTHLTHESYDSFCLRVQHTLLHFSPAIIDRTIESMPKRMDAIIKAKGQRIKY